MSNIGIMDPAFFVGKNVLLTWLNDFFHAGYSKVEQMSSGAMHVQILDAIFPAKVNLGRVNFDAKTSAEFVANFKVLQSVFDKENIPKYVDVPKLINGKFQDNLEFLQWMKQFFDKNYAGQEYNAIERREWARAQYKKAHKFAGSGSSAASSSASSSSSAAAAKPAAAAKVTAPKAVPAAAPVSARAAKPVAPSAAAPKTRAAPASSAARISPASAAAETSAISAAELAALQADMKGLETERGFYFEKLREIEILCQDESLELDAPKFKAQVLEILYRTDEENEFQSPAVEEAQATEHDLLDVDNQPVDSEAGLLGNDELGANVTY